MLRTHYDNLKVSRDAPIEVICAAFIALSEKHDPKSNPHSRGAVRVFQIICRSYAVLSDPVRRAEHDMWIAEQESRKEPPRKPLPPTPSEDATPADKLMVRIGLGVVIAVVACMIIFVASDPALPKNTQVQPATKQGQSQPVLIAPDSPIQVRTVVRYERPALAPNGQPWPVTSAYVSGQRKTTGSSTVTVDNTQNASDVLVKLFDRNLNKPASVRVVFLRGGQRFTMQSVKAGEYDIRYQDLASGVISKSEPFSLSEHEEKVSEADGTRRITHFSKFRLTLYTVENGNTQFTVIGPEEF